MKGKKISRTRSTLDVARWISYAAAGAATAVAASNDAEAAILYSGPINQSTPAPSASANIPLKLLSGAHSTFAQLHHSATDAIGFGGSSLSAHAKFKVLGSFFGKVRGHVSSGFPYASKLAAGAAINAGGFNAVGVSNTMAKGSAFGSGYGSWQAPNAPGFLGFQFNAGAGVQYGWARVSVAPAVTFGPTTNWSQITLIDYAYGTPGQAINAGQEVAPEPATLGMLAVGAAGLLALRRRGGGMVAA